MAPIPWKLYLKKSTFVLFPLLACPLLFFGKEMKCVFVIVVVSAYWLFEPVPMGIASLLPLLLFPLFNIIPGKKVSTYYFKDNLVLFMCSLIMAMAVEETNLHRRIALSMLSVFGSNRHCILMGSMVATAFVSFFVSDTAATTLMLPIILAILTTMEKEMKPAKEKESITDGTKTTETAREEGGADLTEAEKAGRIHGLDMARMSKRDKAFCKAMVLSSVHASLIGGTGIITGTGTNLVFREQFSDKYSDYEVSYLNWMRFAMPWVPLYLVASWFSLIIVLMPYELVPKRWANINEKEDGDQGKKIKNRIKEALYDMGTISFAEASVMFWFILLLLTWSSRRPGFVTGWSDLFPQKTVEDSTVAVFVAMLMFIWPRRLSDSKLQPILNWELMKTKYSWSCTLLIGAGFCLSEGVKASGLSNLIACQMNTYFDHMEPFWLQFLATLVACFCTEFASNVATAGVFLPIMVGLAKGVNLNPLFLVLPVTIACSFAFMLPQATPGNAIVYDTKIVSFTEMASVGLLLNILCVWLTVFNFHTWGYWLMDLGTVPPGLHKVTANLTCL